MNGALETYGTISKVLIVVSLLSQNERRKKLVYYPSTKKKKNSLKKEQLTTYQIWRQEAHQTPNKINSDYPDNNQIDENQI